MPVEPQPSMWDMAALARGAEREGVDDLLAVGADLEPGTLLAAYRHGLFPMPSDTRDATPSWWSPADRGVLPLDGLRISRSLRRSLRDYEVRVDTDFGAVVDGCADPTRDGAWIDVAIRTAYLRLHELGWAHSVETWRDGELVGGLYGVAIGGLFAGESMFHRARDASKVALVRLVELMREDGDQRRLLDVQWSTEHLASLGVVEVPRAVYVERVSAALDAPYAPGLLTAAGPQL